MNKHKNKASRKIAGKIHNKKQINKGVKAKTVKSAKNFGKSKVGAKKPLEKPLSAKALKALQKIQEEAAKKAAEEEQRKFIQKITKILGDARVRQNLIDLGGENALAIIRNFQGNRSDDDLAKTLKIKISDVRATLNKLHNEGLVNYMREKDSETGWYSYSWALNKERMDKWADAQTNRLGNLEAYNSNDYYFCSSCGASSIINFESASNSNFRCDACNRLLEFLDDEKMTQLNEKKF